MSKIGYATYIRHRLSGFEVGDVPRATPGRSRRLPALPRPPRPGGRQRQVPAPDLPRADHLRAPRAAAAGPRPSAGRDRRSAGRRGVHECALAGDHRAVSAQRVLRHARRVPRRDRRGDEARVRGDRRRRRAAADRRARPGDGPPHHVPRSLRRGVRRRAPSATSRRSTMRCATSPPTACGCTSAGATTRARTTSTSTCAKIVDVILRGQAGHAPVRGRQPAPRPRLGHLARGQDPRRQGARPGRAGLDHQLHRAPRAGRPAAAHLRRDRRTGAGRSPAPTAGSAPGPGSGRSILTSAGPRCARCRRERSWPAGGPSVSARAPRRRRRPAPRFRRRPRA